MNMDASAELHDNNTGEELVELMYEVDITAVPGVTVNQDQMDRTRHDVGAPQAHMDLPLVRSTPINEFNNAEAVLSGAFFQLFPYGKGEFVQARQRNVTWDSCSSIPISETSKTCGSSMQYELGITANRLSCSNMPQAWRVREGKYQRDTPPISIR